MEKKKIIPIVFLISFLLVVFLIQKNGKQVLAAPDNKTNLQSTPGSDPVPLSAYEISFTDYGEGTGNNGSSCLTRGVKFTNKDSRPMNIFLYYVNQDGTTFTLESGLVPANSSNTVPIDLGVIRIGGPGDTPGYVLPYSATAMYPNNLIVMEHQTIVHPCDGYLGVVVSGNNYQPPANEPTAPTQQSPETLPTQGQAGASAVEKTETSDETAVLMYVLFTGSIDGFENTPAGQNLTLEQRMQIRNSLIAMGLLLPSEIDFYVYPDGHPCQGYTSRNLCEPILENKKNEIAEQLVIQEIADRAAERALQRQRAQHIVTEEISNLWTFWDYIKNSRDILFSADPLEATYEKLSDKAKDEVKNRINERIKANTDNQISIFDIKSYDDVIKDGVKLVTDLATIRSADDYEYYRNIYIAQIQENIKPEDSPEVVEQKRLAAHQAAMDQLSTHIKNGFPGRAAYLGAYDRAFIRLNRIYGEQ